MIVTGPPAPTPVTSPLLETVAIAVLPLAQVTTRPESGLPLASLGVAVSCTVAPCATDAVAGVTLTDATGTAMTLIVAVPLLPSLVAVIVAEPAPTPVTSPLASTVTTTVLLLVHAITRPGSGVLLASSAVPVSCTVAPWAIDAVGGVTLTDATGIADTVTVAEPP